MRILHVVPSVSGTSIPVEIATALDDLPDVDAAIVSERPLPDELPDTVSADVVLAEACGFDSYGRLLADVASDFDAVHTHHVGPAAKAGVRSRRRPIRHITTQHGHSHYTLAEKAKNLPGLAIADVVVYNSRTTAASYGTFERALKFRAAEHVVHNGVDVTLTEDHRARIETPTRAVTAARLIPRKNLGTLVRALVHAEAVSLDVVGDGPARDDLERVAREAGVADRVDFRGYLPAREDVYEVYAESDVFVLPSHGEGFCVAAAEAMAVGLPVVVSDLPVFHEVVGESGVFVDRTSPAAIADALAGLRGDPDRARRLGARNRERIHEHFTLAECARGYRDVYRETLG